MSILFLALGGVSLTVAVVYGCLVWHFVRSSPYVDRCAAAPPYNPNTDPILLSQLND
jgi:hypothetical protein